MGVGSGVSGGGDVSVSLKFMVGEAQSLRRENSSLKNLIEVRRLGFPNVIMPGDVRCVFSSVLIDNELSTKWVSTIKLSQPLLVIQCQNSVRLFVAFCLTYFIV